MKARLSLSVLFVLLIAACAPARADLLTGLLVDASSRLLSKAGHAVVASVKEAVTPKETDEERKLRENADVTEMTGTAVDLHFPKVDRAINCVIDGELLPMDREVSIRLHPGELKVMVPKAEQKIMTTAETAAA